MGVGEHKADEFGKSMRTTTDLNSGDGQVTGSTLIMLQGLDEERDANPYIVRTPQPGLELWKLAAGLVAMFILGVAIFAYFVLSGSVAWPPKLFERSTHPVSTPPVPVIVTIRNESSETIPPSILRNADGSVLAHVPRIAPGDVATMRPALPDHAENSLVLVADNRAYTLVGTLDGNPGGTVTVLIRRRAHGFSRGEVIDATGDRLGWKKLLAPAR